jgi:hypothetical protein
MVRAAIRVEIIRVGITHRLIISETPQRILNLRMIEVLVTGAVLDSSALYLSSDTSMRG